VCHQRRLSQAHHRELTLHGWVFDIATGAVEVVNTKDAGLIAS
jgi:carbonic anhydrase